MNAKVWERRVDPHFGYLRTECGCEIVDWSDKGLAGNERGQESQIRAGAVILDIGRISSGGLLRARVPITWRNFALPTRWAPKSCPFHLESWTYS